jgi:exonuclease SbcC
MTEARLRSLTVSDFRSIRGRAVIPLEAPVVLLQGTNGAGKSTVMSALELALTGAVTGIDPIDASHLVHRGAESAQIDLATSDRNVTFTIEGSEIAGDPLLAPEDARFFAERCYLQQRTLGRLLELYQERAGDNESALTAFVNELLGLDELDALIDGLYPVLHVARIRRLVPDFSDAEQQQNVRDDQIRGLEAEVRNLEATVAKARAELSDVLAGLEAPPAIEGDADAAAVWLNDIHSTEERALVDLLAAQRELAALAKRAEALAERPGAADLNALEKTAADARDAADNWRAVHRAPLEALLDELRHRLPGIPAAGGADDPAAVRDAALGQVTAELERLDSALRTDETARREVERLERTVNEARARLEVIQEQLAESPVPTAPEELANALAALIPHVHTDDCPVCGRDYSEVANEPLAAHIALRVSELSARAQQLQELTKAASAASTELSGAESQRKVILGQLMEPDAKVAAQASRALLVTAQQQLVDLAAGVAEGAGLLRAQTEAERDLSVAREQDSSSADLRREIEAYAVALGQPRPAQAAAAIDAIAALSEHVTARIETLERRAAQRTRAGELIDAVGKTVSAQSDLRRKLAELEAEGRRTAAAIAELGRRRKIMRNLRDEAERARTQIVQRVLTNSLNRAWRDLFVRLAPEEPFVPAFRIPNPGERVVATLETVHRDGKPGGPPAAMLSAGNLNTAALTLFLALNLSVELRLPWILLDDPVQSMDEVHVAQFAALLRTLTREHGRRVVLAVHDRALFDYLTLELSPATKDEGLQTIELTRGPDGATNSEPDFQGYVEDRALEPA